MLGSVLYVEGVDGMNFPSDVISAGSPTFGLFTAVSKTSVLIGPSWFSASFVDVPK